MKRIILSLAICLCAGNLFAQDANTDNLVKEGDAAMTAKNYPEVVAKYSEYLKATNYEDESRIFNCAFAAFQAKQYDTAVQFYDMAIQKGYKVDDAYTGKAMALRSLDKAAEFSATVEAGLKANAQNTNLEKLLYGYCTKKAQAAQKAGKLTEAEDLFKDVLVVNNKQYKGNALYSLGVMFYNNGAKILTAANPIAQTEPEKYAAEKKKADAEMAKAKGYLEQAIALNPNDANSKKILDATNTVLNQ